MQLDHFDRLEVAGGLAGEVHGQHCADREVRRD
jgi:hypothetical protein